MRGVARAWWANAVVLLIAGAIAPACGSDKDEGGGDSFCGTFEGRQRQCGVITGEGRTNCVNYNDAPEPCETACLQKASCLDIIGQSCGPSTEALSNCMGRCVGLEPITCKDGTHLPGYSRCDGVAQCGFDADGVADETDEVGCTTVGFQCRSVDQRVAFVLLCDGNKDCTDGSDEPPDCKVLASCDGGTDVTVAMTCNGVAECADGTDEPADCAARMCN